MADHTITTLESLQALFGAPSEASLRKETTSIHPVYRQWIERAPFYVLATSGPGGLDASPRGDPAGFVAVQDEHTLLLPERRGNNRIDSLRNIVADPRVALLFLIPGIGETLRVNGRAGITVDPALLQRFAMQGKPPQCVIEVKVEAVYFQCSRALQRSQLWGPLPRPDGVPTAGAILEGVTSSAIDGKAYDQAAPLRQRDTLY